ncbi:hypothetical protein HPO96_37050 [Kribbella sandramycini]|uniref:Uncharacterized protein n=1 Tax=Kribbella sandramycini TaxID=60450 RepID=A0A7Y4L7R5_9ACTN|nr:hypothetical protein [Kribbella sandramycini]MBB6564406.1 hypothetical protein [Kribbella sandramycini]NOL45868.1 hypothetical protein [Kribbella sandramycini]
MSNDAFSDPSTATGIQWKDLHGALVLVKVHAIETGINTVHGASDAVRADVIVLDGKADGDIAEGDEFIDTLVFPKVLQSQLKSKVGGMVLGRVSQGNKKPGQSAPWTLTPANEADKAKGRDYLAKNTEAPF